MRLLLELEPESDPVWHYLNIQVGIHMFLICFQEFHQFLSHYIMVNIQLASYLGFEDACKMTGKAF